MSIDREDWSEIQNQIGAVLDKYADFLDVETVDAVRHYIDHDEYEMAFEGLCLDLLDQKVKDVDWPLCIALARRLGLDKESVFDPGFWGKLSGLGVVVKVRLN